MTKQEKHLNGLWLKEYSAENPDFTPNQLAQLQLAIQRAINDHDSRDTRRMAIGVYIDGIRQGSKLA